jgi:hypothetical protein
MDQPIIAPTLSSLPGPSFDLGEFASPGTAHRGAPLWAWNCKLEEAELLEQIGQMHEMGLGGFHIHVRIGLEDEYLGNEFMRLVRICVEQARELGMYAWLYDEDRWPSGYAGGLVTQDVQYRSRHLLLTETPYAPGEGATEQAGTSRADGARNGNGDLLGRYAIKLIAGKLDGYRRLADEQDAAPDERLLYAYLETALPQAWFNNQTYVDTLNPRAMQRFVDVTHERYKAVVGDAFGTTIPAIFTDEPQFPHKQALHFADDRGDLILPWTGDFAASFEDAFGFDILDRLPELLWELPDGGPSKARYGYHDHVCERFASAFADTIGGWCDRNGIALTGHMMEEPTLTSQTQALGEAMRSFRSFTLPGIDMLCDRIELTTAKQAQSAARQFGHNGVMSELYGVTNWDFDFASHKRQGDWQAALGVTLRVHHLTWVSMAGEAKRDYPASIGYQSAWWREYPVVEDHFARLNVALKAGTPQVRIGVIHPIESFWLCFGPLEHTAIERETREAQFENLTHWLLHGLLDFDFIAESLLPQLTPEDAAVPFKVGAMAYDVIVVPGLRTIRASTLTRLLSFARKGGRVVIAGGSPNLVDAEVSDAVAELTALAETIPFERSALLGALEPQRAISLRQAHGSAAGTMIHQLREDGDTRLLFLCNTDREHGFADMRLDIAGRWSVTALDTATGSDTPLPIEDAGDGTRLVLTIAAHGHALLRLTHRQAAAPAIARRVQSEEPIGELSGPFPVTLSESNVLLLDQAKFRLDDGPWQKREEILRADNVARAALGWPQRMDTLAQPWVDQSPPDRAHSLGLRFRIETDIALSGASLGLERLKDTRIELDGTAVPSIATGWFVDKSIATVALPDMAPGRHELLLTIRYHRKSNPEWCYLLGDFGVRLEGRQARVVAPVRSLGFGDWTSQGLPFYAGNVTYHCGPVDTGRDIVLRAARFAAPLLAVDVDGARFGTIAFAPYELDLGGLAPGSHDLAITAFGSRVNAFGALHNWDADERWHGPSAWRSTGDRWGYEYNITRAGILVAPRLLRKQGRSA